MAETLATLVKLSEHKIEDVQKNVRVVRDNIANVEQKRLALLEAVARGGEMAAAANDVTMLTQAAAFAQSARKQEEALVAKRRELEEELEALMERLRAEFATQKRYETLLQRERLRAKKRREAKQQAQLDEVAGVGDWLAGQRD